MSRLHELLKRLALHQMEIVLVGGYAVEAVGCSLLTQDVDVACSMTPENLLRLYGALEDLHPTHRMTPSRLPFTKEDAIRSGWRNIYLQTDWRQLDRLGEVAGLGGFEECLAQSEVLPMNEFSLRILTLDALIESKRALDRPRDRHAVMELEVIRERLRNV